MKKIDITVLSDEERAAILARRNYQRQWRKEHKAAVKEHNRRFWLKKAAEKYVEGNGKVIVLKDVTGDYPISLAKVIKALEAANFEKTEIEQICRCLLINDMGE